MAYIRSLCNIAFSCIQCYIHVILMLIARDRLKSLFHSSQKPTRKLAAITFIQSQYLNVLAVNLRVVFCDEWKRAFSRSHDEVQETKNCYWNLFIFLFN